MVDKIKEFENKSKTDNEVGVVDDIGVDILVKQVSNLYDEEEAFRVGKENAIKNKENYSVQWDIDKRLQELQLEHFGMTEEGKTHKIHFVPEFWDLQKKKFEFEVRMERVKAESNIKGFEAEEKRADERMAEIKNQIAKKVARLKELGVEIPVNPYTVVDKKQD